jgi:hypothetical protein
VRRELALFVSLAALPVLPTLLHPGHTVGDGVDAFGTHWFYWWIRTCVEHFGTPSHTNLFLYPFGKAIFQHTGNNFVDAVMSVPLQWLLGATLWSPVWTVLLSVGNALAFRPLARHVLGDGLPALAATVLWQVNPYLGFELTAGRPTQALAWWIPIAIWSFLRCADGDGRDAVRLGIAVALTGWTYWYAALFLCCFLLPFVERRGLGRYAQAAALALVLVFPAVVPMTQAVAEGKVPGASLPGAEAAKGPMALANNVSVELHGLWLMESAGARLFTQPAWLFPLLFAAFRRALGWRWWAALLICVGLGLGPAVRWGEELVPLEPYATLYRWFPFVNRLWFPYRFAGVAFVAAALLVGSQVRSRAVLAGLVALGLGGQAWGRTWPYNHHDARCPELLAALPPGGALVFLPFGLQHDGLMWQTTFRLPTLGGMGESAPIFWPARFRRLSTNSYVRALRGATAGDYAPWNPEEREDFLERGFRWVALRRELVESEARRLGKVVDLAAVITRLDTVVGHPPIGVEGALVLWDFEGTWSPEAGLAATPARLAAHDWPADAPPAYSRGFEAEDERRNRRPGRR